MKIGYCRVSTAAQNIDRQMDALTDAGCEKIYVDRYTGTKADRPQLNEMFSFLRAGDKIVVTELARLGRSTKDIFNLIDRIEKAGAEFESLKDKIDTATPQGKFFFTVNCAFVQLQRDMIVINVKEGLKAARARGRVGGRPPKNKKQVDRALELYKSQNFSLKEISEMTGVSVSTIYNYLKKQNSGCKQQTEKSN